MADKVEEKKVKIDERKVWVASSGSVMLTLPRFYVEDVGLGKGRLVEIFRQGDSLIIKPKKGPATRESPRKT